MEGKRLVCSTSAIANLYLAPISSYIQLIDSHVFFCCMLGYLIDYFWSGNFCGRSRQGRWLVFCKRCMIGFLCWFGRCTLRTWLVMLHCQFIVSSLSVHLHAIIEVCLSDSCPGYDNEDYDLSLENLNPNPSFNLWEAFEFIIIRFRSTVHNYLVGRPGFCASVNSTSM